MGIGNIGIDTDRLAVTFDRLLDLTSLIKQITQIDVRGGQQRIGGQGAAVARNGRAMASEDSQGDTHVAVSIGEPGVQPDGPGIVLHGGLQVAPAAGARVAVYGTARDTHRLRLAEQLGAHATGVGMTADEVDNPTGDGVDFVFECSGNADGAALGLRLTRRMGHYTQVGLFGEPPRLDFDTTVVARELTIRGSFGQRPSSWDRALELMAAGSVNPAALITHVLPLQDWESGFEVCRSGRAGKVLFDLSGIDAARPRPASGGAGPKTVPDRS